MPKRNVVLPALAAASALLTAAAALLPGPLYAAEVLDLGTAFTLLLDAVPPLGIAAVALGTLCLGVALRRRAWGVAALGAAAALVGLAAVLAVADFRRTAAANPLHDVTTDLDAPPSFRALEARRYAPGGPDARAAAPHPDWRATHAEIYPDLETLTLDAPLDQAFARARRAAEAMGWAIEATEQTGTGGRLEAVDQTGWFGFRDDIVVVLRPAPAGGVAVDARSVSRIGVSDLGKNAERLRAFLARLAP